MRSLLIRFDQIRRGKNLLVEKERKFLLWFNTKKTSESGNAIVEFAIILPLLALLILGVVEYTQIFKIKEFQTLVTREAGSVAYRYCFERTQHDCNTVNLLDEGGTPIPSTTQNLEACLTEWRSDIKSNIQGMLTGVDLTISFYRFEASVGDPDPPPPGSGTITFLAASTKDKAGMSATDSHYFESPITLRRDFERMLMNNEIIVIAESFVTFPFTWLTIFLPDEDVPQLELYHVSAY